MVWEYLRACYSFTLRVFVGGVPTLVPARWYWCAPGALHFPGVKGFVASPWLKQSLGEVNTDWGEVTPYPTDPNAAAIRGLDRGRNPGYPGQCYVGDPQWFIDGQLPAGILGDPVPPFVPCCLPSPATATGTIVVSGQAVPSRVGLVYGCTQCAGGAQSQWVLTIVGGTGAFAVFNGIKTLPYQTGCRWKLGTFTSWLLQWTLAGGWQVALVQGTVAATYTAAAGGFDCFAGGTFQLSASSGSGTPAASVTIAP